MGVFIIVNFGCGIGRHTLEFYNKGYKNIIYKREQFSNDFKEILLICKKVKYSG